MRHYVLVTLLCIWSIIPLGQGLVVQAQTSSPGSATVNPSNNNPQQAGSPTVTENTKWASETQTQLVEMFEMVLRVLFLIMAPLLAIAAVALDNTLIYGSIFNLDAILWQFWQMMRNFANFALWLLFVWKVLEYLLKSKTTWVDLGKTVKSVVVWAILVQASWFIMAVLIDLSTIGVYGLWAMPLTIITDSWEPIEKVSYAVTTTLYNIDAWSSDSLLAAPFAVYYSCLKHEKKMLPCSVEQGKLIDAEKRNTYKESYISTRNNSFSDNTEHILKLNDIDDNHCVWLWNILKNQKWDPLSTPQDIQKLRADQEMTANEWECPTIPKLLEKASWITWPLYTLYMSMLSMSAISVPPTKSAVFEVSVEFLLKTVTAIMLLLPLAALCIVLLMRIVYLWLYIAISPFLVLWYIFNIKFVEEQKFLKKDNVFGLIFMPVLVTFALSLWVIFLSFVIRADEIWPKDGKWVVEHLWAVLIANDANNEKCYEFIKLFQLCFTGTEREFGAWIWDVMSYVIVNGFAIAVVWFLVFAALKSNEITWWIAASIESLWQWIIKSVPIMWWVSLWGAQYALNQMPNIWDSIVRKQSAETFDPLFEQWEQWASKDKKTIDKNMKNGLTAFEKSNETTPNATQQNEALNIIQEGAHPGTTYNQYQHLPGTLALAGGVDNPSKIKTIDEALKNKDVLRILATTPDTKNSWSLLKNFWENWNKSSWNLQKTSTEAIFESIKKSLDQNANATYKADNQPLTSYRITHNNKSTLFMVNQMEKTLDEIQLPEKITNNQKLSDMNKQERTNILKELNKLITLNDIKNSDVAKKVTNWVYDAWINEIIWPNPDLNVTQRTIGSGKNETKVIVSFLPNNPNIINSITIEENTPATTPANTPANTPATTPANTPATTPANTPATTPGW
jgi:hypothetical protein